MNNQIREFEKQCWSHRVDNTLIDGQLHFDTQKFARLIVQECARLVRNRSEFITQQARLYADDYDEEVWARATAWQFKIFEQEVKQHFGVEA